MFCNFSAFQTQNVTDLYGYRQTRGNSSEFIVIQPEVNQSLQRFEGQRRDISIVEIIILQLQCQQL